MYQDKPFISDFEFYYLVELTRTKIKPLSRFEKALDRKTLKWLQKQGFYTERVWRKLHSGKSISETIFSRSSRYIDSYQRKFNRTYLMKDNREKRFEGFFFGYPSCCVEQFIHRPYIQNDLNPEDQALLFHWACHHCRSTAELLPLYRAVHQEVREWYDDAARRNIQNEPASFRKIPTVAATLLLFSHLASAQSLVDSSHYIPLPDDINLNALSYAEEVYLGLFDQGTIAKCQTSAKFFKTIIDLLPADTIHNDRVYKINHKQRGMIQCPKCGESIVMGYISVVNPRRQLTMDISYLGLHFMGNGFFSYGDDDQFERVNIDTLRRILYPFDLAHLLPVSGDSDGDGLTDAEEDSLFLGYTAEMRDSDGDGVPDGAQIAEDLTRLFPKLKETPDNIHSHLNFKLVYGLENCQVCGSTHNMGTVEIINPENKRTCEIPIISLHALAHGSFAYDGTEHVNGRLNAVNLVRTIYS